MRINENAPAPAATGYEGRELGTGSTTSAYPLDGLSSTTVHTIASGPDVDISVIHDQERGYAVANLSAHGLPDTGTDLSLPELHELLGYLSAAAAVLGEYEPVPYSLVD